MMVFGMTRPRGELTTYRARGGHAIDWANPTRYYLWRQQYSDSHVGISVHIKTWCGDAYVHSCMVCSTNENKDYVCIINNYISPWCIWSCNYLETSNFIDWHISCSMVIFSNPRTCPTKIISTNDMIVSFNFNNNNNLDYNILKQ